MNEYFLDRHFKLWEDNNKQINRVVFLTVVLSLALVIKVLVPFVEYSEDKKPVIETIENLNRDKATANEKIVIIQRTADVLQDVNKFISQQPWQQEKQALINRYKDMRESPSADGYSRERYQQEANDTINRIVDLSKRNILLPLKQSTVGIVAAPDDHDALIGEVESLEHFFVDWKEEYINKNWYRTIDRKDQTMYELSASLTRRLDEFSNVVSLELEAVNQAKAAVDRQLAALDKKIVTNQGELQALDAELQKILPEWLRGLIKIEQVIQLLPAVLFAAAAFVVALGMSLTRHFKIYTTGKKFDREITEDPGMSTTWTLIHRGLLGSILTLTAYTVFIVFTWLLFEKSMMLLLEWLSIDPSKAWISSHGFWIAFLWSIRAGFVLLLAYVFKNIKIIRPVTVDE